MKDEITIFPISAEHGTFTDSAGTTFEGIRLEGHDGTAVRILFTPEALLALTQSLGPQLAQILRPDLPGNPH